MTPLRDAAESATAGVPVVRGLEWTASDITGDTMERAHTGLGLYRIWTFHGANGQWFWSRSFGNITDGRGAPQGGPEAAKAACQADYERRGREILNPDFLSELDTARAEIDRLGKINWALGAGNASLAADLSQAQSALTAAQARIAELEARDRLSVLHVEALAEIKATVDGQSDQPVRDIIYGLLAEIATLSPVKENDRG